MSDLVNYLKLGQKALANKNFENAINFFNKALPTAEKKDQIEIYKALGDIHYDSSKFKQAIIEYTNALKVAAELNDVKVEIKLLQTMGNICQEMKSGSRC